MVGLTPAAYTHAYSKTTLEMYSSDLTTDPKTAGIWEYKLVHFGEKKSLYDAKEESESGGWESTKWEHLLAFGSAFPEEQLKYPVVALGYMAGRYNPLRIFNSNAPVLSSFELSPRALVRRSCKILTDDYRVLVVRKVSNT